MDFIPYIVSFVIVLITLAIFVFSRRPNRNLSSKKCFDGVVLVGCCGSGKTTIANQLCHNVVPSTLTSMEPTYYTLALKTGRKLNLVDFPGHERLKAAMLQTVCGARGVVVVVDSVSMSAIKQTAFLIFDLLTAKAFSDSTPLLVFCNKSDEKEAKSSDRVKVILQREIDSMRKTSGTISEAGLSEQGNKVLGVDGHVFSFDSMRKVTFASGSAISALGFDDLLRFMELK